MLRYPDRWGHLKGRYERKAPRKLLALDGGGIRGLITIGILEKLETLLSEASGRGSDFRLCDYFDYIGGTSTGAIIAAGLARGMAVGELRDFYLQNGEAMFKQAFLLERVKSLHTDEPLRAKLREVFGEKTNMCPEHLRCLLLIVAKNNSTDSAWPVSSNPDARYNDPGRADCNLRIPLWQLLRASTAAPVFFPPEVLEWDPADVYKDFVFVDGGVTAYNNPAFLMQRMATEPSYALEWETGERKMLVVSVGTGSAPTTSDNLDALIPSIIKQTLSHIMDGAQVDQDINCRTIGRCTHGPFLDREILDLTPREGSDEGSLEQRLARPMIPLERDLGRRFLYARYDAELTGEGLKRLGVRGEPMQLRRMNNADKENMEKLLAVGRAAGRAVKLEHLGAWFQPGMGV